jgi:ABC-2 type transport system ATP-binding protein
VEYTIETNNLTVILGGKVKAVKDVSFELPRGHIIGLLGPSGAGKSTLIRTIIGRQKPRGGSVTVLGQPAGTKQLRSQIGYMPQSTSIYSDLTVLENLEYFAAVHGSGKKEARRVMDEVDMAKYAGRVVSDLSGGQQSRVSLGAALIGKPQILILDEPTVGLDPVLRHQLWELFRKLADKGVTLLVSSHVMDEAEHCDTLMLIRGGRLLTIGPPRQLCKDAGVDDIEALFLKLVKKEAV